MPVNFGERPDYSTYKLELSNDNFKKIKARIDELKNQGVPEEEAKKTAFEEARINQYAEKYPDAANDSHFGGSSDTGNGEVIVDTSGEDMSISNFVTGSSTEEQVDPPAIPNESNIEETQPQQEQDKRIWGKSADERRGISKNGIVQVSGLTLKNLINGVRGNLTQEQQSSYDNACALAREGKLDWTTGVNDIYQKVPQDPELGKTRNAIKNMLKEINPEEYNDDKKAKDVATQITEAFIRENNPDLKFDSEGKIIRDQKFNYPRGTKTIKDPKTMEFVKNYLANNSISVSDNAAEQASAPASTTEVKEANSESLLAKAKGLYNKITSNKEKSKTDEGFKLGNVEFPEISKIPVQMLTNVNAATIEPPKGKAKKEEVETPKVPATPQAPQAKQATQATQAEEPKAEPLPENIAGAVKSGGSMTLGLSAGSASADSIANSDNSAMRMGTFGVNGQANTDDSIAKDTKVEIKENPPVKAQYDPKTLDEQAQDITSVNEAREALEKAKTEYNVHNTKLENVLRPELARLKDEATDKETAKNKVNSEFEEAMKTYEDKNSAYTKANGELTDLKKQQDEAKTALGQAEKDKDSKVNRMLDIQKKEQQTDDELNEYNRLQQEIESLDKIITKQKGILEGTNEKLGLNAQVTEKEKQVGKLEEEKTAALKAKNQKGKEKNKAESDYDTAKTKRDNYEENTVKPAQDKKTQLEQDVTKANQNLQQTLTNVVKAGEKLKEAADIKSEADKKVSEKQEEIDNLKNEKSKHESAKTEWQKKLDEEAKNFDNLIKDKKRLATLNADENNKNSIKYKEKQIVNSNANITQLESDKNTKQVEIDAKKDDLEKAKIELSKAINEFEELKKKKEDATKQGKTIGTEELKKYNALMKQIGTDGDLTKKVNEYAKAVEDLEKQKAEIDKKLETTREDLKKFGEELQELETEKARLSNVEENLKISGEAIQSMIVQRNQHNNQLVGTDQDVGLLKKLEQAKAELAKLKQEQSEAEQKSTEAAKEEKKAKGQESWWDRLFN